MSNQSPTTKNTLLQKIAETLTPVEHQGLLDLIDTVEQFDAVYGVSALLN